MALDTENDKVAGMEPFKTRSATSQEVPVAATRSGAEAKMAELDQTVKAVAEGVAVPARLWGEGRARGFKNDPRLQTSELPGVYSMIGTFMSNVHWAPPCGLVVSEDKISKNVNILRIFDASGFCKFPFRAWNHRLTQTRQSLVFVAVVALSNPFCADRLAPQDAEVSLQAAKVLWLWQLWHSPSSLQLGTWP